jgi:Xaa-Pro aminopeptidase
MTGPFTSDFRARLARVRQHVAHAGLDALLVSHLPNVRYLTGFAGTSGTFVLTGERATLLVDSRYVTAAEELVRRGAADFDVTAVRGSADEAAAAVLKELGCHRIGIEAASLSVARFSRLSAALAGHQPPSRGSPVGRPGLVATERLVERVRMVKDAGEVATLREAAGRLSGVAREALRIVTPGRPEREIAADIELALRRAGFERPAFETIVASGPNSALPHARPTGRPVGRNEPVVLDFGGVYDGYCVDLTRTLHAGASPEALRRMFAAVVEARAAAVGAVRPGARASDVDAAARGVLDRRGLGEAFGHGTGHGLGLEVHEDPRLTRAGTGHPDAVLEPGMVFTIEPGAYVPGVGGVRIEDDVLVVDGGAEILTDVPIDP